MRIAFIETSSLTNELIRAVAGAAPNCMGYPDGVPESWADVSAAQRVREEPRRQFTAPPRYDAEYWAALAVMDAGYGIDPAEYGADPAALLGPVAEPVDWPDERGDDEC